MLDKQLQAALDKRRDKGTLRRLTCYETVTHAVHSSSSPASSPMSLATTGDRPAERLIDFSSNDYMGLGHANEMRKLLISKLQQSVRFPLGSTGSRLLDGNSYEHEQVSQHPSLSIRTLADWYSQLEDRLATHFGAPSALLFNSGFDANVSLLSTLPQPNDYILCDSLVHASVHDGVRASRTAAHRRLTFQHSDLDDLSRVLESICAQASSSSSNVFVVVEAVYSMDGDLCPLAELTKVVDAKIARGRRCIIVDEAHAVGLYGLNGAGLSDGIGVSDSIDIRLATFGKAFGSSGAAVLCTPLVRHFLINYARPLIYSTAIPHPTLLSIHSALDILVTPNGLLRATKTFALTKLLLDGVRKILAQHPECQLSLPFQLSMTSKRQVGNVPISPIIPILSSDPRALASHLIQTGYLVRPICYPTVPKGAERVRICVHSHNETEDVLGLVKSIKEWVHHREENVRSKL